MAKKRLVSQPSLKPKNYKLYRQPGQTLVRQPGIIRLPAIVDVEGDRRDKGRNFKASIRTKLYTRGESIVYCYFESLL